MIKSCLLVVIFISSSVNFPIPYTDWCKLVSKDSKYTGLGIYHQRNADEDYYVMWNTFGNEWQFKVSKTDHKWFGIEMIEGSVKPFNSQYIVNRWSTFRQLGKVSYEEIVCQCKLSSIPGNTDFTLVCNGSDNRKTQIKDNIFGNRVIMKARPHSNDDIQAEYVLMFNKSDDIKEYDPILVDGCSHDIYYRCDDSNRVGCEDQPRFVEDMNATIFKTIEGVIDFNFGKPYEDSGHMLLLTINGSPMICFTIEGQDISEECKNISKMRPIFEECFNTLPLPTTITPMTTTLREEPDNTKTWILIGVIIVIVIAIIIAIIIAIVCCIQRKKKTEKSLVAGSSHSVTEYLENMEEGDKFQILKFKDEASTTPQATTPAGGTAPKVTNTQKG